MAANASTTRPVVLTTEGRTWLEGRLSRVTAHLEQVSDDLASERTDELLREQAQLSEQRDQLAQLLRDAVSPGEIIDDPELVELGDEVEVEFPDNSQETFLIVHPAEAGLDEHRTSADSPLAAAVLGSRPGERVTVTSPAGVYSCTIVERRRLG